MAQTPHAPSSTDARDRRDGWFLPDEMLSIRDVVGILLRRRMTIVLTVMAVTVPALAYSLASGPRYTATASVMLEATIAAGQPSPVGSVLDTQRDIIRSRELVRATMTDLNLYEADDYRSEPADPNSLKSRVKGAIEDAIENAIKSVASWLPVDIGSFAEPAAAADENLSSEEIAARESAESAFAKSLTVSQSGESFVLGISFTSRDPERAATVANHLANLYVQRQLADKQEAAARTEAWLSARVAQMRNDLLEVERELATFRSQYQFRVDEAAARSRSAVAFQELQREAEAKRAAYEVVLGRYYNNRGTVDGMTPDARLISRAQTPTRPSSPPAVIIAFVSLAASGVMGCGFAFLREQMDRRAHDSRQVEAALRMPCLGVVPKVKKVRGPLSEQALLATSPRSVYGQAMQSLNLRIVAAEHSPQILLITSALPGEGKSALAAGLAAARHQTGDARVLLVDFDLWSPKVAKRFGISTQAPGVGTLLERGPAQSAPDGAVDEPLLPESMILRDPATGIDILPAGPKAGADRVLSLPATMGLLDRLRPHYDFIVIDAPSLLIATDVQPLALCADATLLAVRWGHTNLDVAGAGLALLRDIGAPVLGVALTQMDLTQSARHVQDHNLQRYREVQRHLG